MNAANLPTFAASNAVASTYSAEALFANKAAGLVQAGLASQLANQQVFQPPKGNAMSARRIVQVFVADPNDNLSLDDCLLFKGEEKLTDATDQELFFELDIKEMLEAHNAKRIKIIDKKVKDRTEYLEAAKVRDLKMVVVTVANL